jgi:two-component system response regulator GlrR
MAHASHFASHARSIEREGSSGRSILIGNSPAIRTVMAQIAKIARSDAPILIQGETGSGKELAARAIKQESARRTGAFVAVNCGALPEGLIETELFGHAQGAFTDARQARDGVIAAAQGGTLFLDEIDTLSLRAQVMLLRYLQDHRYRPVGVSHEIASDARVIAASNQPLDRLVEDGRFRRDLLYRLNIFELTIPPLRVREDDVEMLARHFVEAFSAKYGMPPKQLHPDTIAWLRQHTWPGNVRELENWVHRELLLAESDEIRYRDEGQAAAPRSSDPCAADDGLDDYRTAKARAIERFEHAYLHRVLTAARGNVTAAARIAGKERRALGKLLKKHRIDRAIYLLHLIASTS